MGVRTNGILASHKVTFLLVIKSFARYPPRLRSAHKSMHFRVFRAQVPRGVILCTRGQTSLFLRLSAAHNSRWRPSLVGGKDI
jgi:hypothetical protein